MVYTLKITELFVKFSANFYENKCSEIALFCSGMMRFV